MSSLRAAASAARRPGLVFLSCVLATVFLWRMAGGTDTARDVKPQRSSPAAGAASWDKPYMDPRAVVRHFKSELAKILEDEDVIAPADLAKQAEEATTCEAETLADPGQKLAPEEIYERARRSVVIVGGITKREKDRGWSAYCAAGFAITKDGLIATNFHVFPSFKDMKAVGVMTHEGRVFPVSKVVAADKHSDVAVLKIDAQDLVPLPIAADVPVGAKVYCLSHPALNSAKTENAFYAFTEGMVSGKYRLRLSGREPVRVLTITADYAVGSSGGPILNEHGAAVGMACQTMPVIHDQSQNDVQMIWKFGRPASTLLSLLKDSQPST